MEGKAPTAFKALICCCIIGVANLGLCTKPVPKITGLSLKKVGSFSVNKNIVLKTSSAVAPALLRVKLLSMSLWSE